MPEDEAGLLPWSWAESELVKASNYWIISVRPDGRPHASPVWGVWLDGTLYFDGSEQTRRMQNIAAKPEIVVHLESGDEVVVLEGRAGPVPAPPARSLTEKLSALYTGKYADHDYKPKPDQWDRGGLYAMQPHTALGWTFRKGETFGATYT
ncbi:MAG TPA: pyridoxamine 5'-phosphate oxidase family protein, partial [Pseudomonadales bacterium]